MDNSINYNRINLIQSLLDDAVSKKLVAGCSCLIVKAGKEIGYFESGYRDVENNVKITRDTIFRMFSMTKPVTSIAVMQLLEDGKIALCDPVSKYLDGFKNQKCYDNGKITSVTKEVTIKNLLDMTSGISYPGETYEAEYDASKFFEEAGKKLHTEEEMNTIDLINELGRLPLAFRPGSRWNYGASADVLGAVVEVVSGMKFSEYMKKYIFEPLEMFETDFYVSDERQYRLAKSYYANGEAFSEYTGENLLIQSRMEERPKFESGGAGLSSTIDDYSKVCTMLLNKGEYKGRRILHPETIRYMTAGGLNEELRKDVDCWNYLAGHTYSNLLRVLVNPAEALLFGSKGEFGWDGWLGTYVAMIPEQDMYILFMQQKPDTGTTELTLRLRNLIASAMK